MSSKMGPGGAILGAGERLILCSSWGNRLSCVDRELEATDRDRVFCVGYLRSIARTVSKMGIGGSLLGKGEPGKVGSPRKDLCKAR